MTPSQRTSLIEWTTVIGALTLFSLTISSFVPSGTDQRGISIASIDEIAKVGDGQFPWNAQLSSGPAPDFEMLNRNGEPVRLSDFRGQVVFLNFWATNCEPCRKERTAAAGNEACGLEEGKYGARARPRLRPGEGVG